LAQVGKNAERMQPGGIGLPGIFLKDKLEKTLDFMRSKNLLGKNVCGKWGFD
jgi:hypothetical protein